MENVHSNEQGNSICKCGNKGICAECLRQEAIVKWKKANENGVTVEGKIIRLAVNC